MMYLATFPPWWGLPKRILSDCADLLVGWQERRIANRLESLEFLSSSEGLLAELDALRTALDPRCREAMGRLFRPKSAGPGDVHKALFGTGVGPVLTTNRDPLLEFAAGPGRTAYTWMKATDALADLREQRPVVFKAHGYATDPESMVSTRREYDQPARDDHYRAVMTHLHAQYSVLFVGYAMNDPFDLDHLLRGQAE